MVIERNFSGGQGDDVSRYTCISTRGKKKLLRTRDIGVRVLAATYAFLFPSLSYTSTCSSFHFSLRCCVCVCIGPRLCANFAALAYARPLWRWRRVLCGVVYIHITLIDFFLCFPATTPFSCVYIAITPFVSVCVYMRGRYSLRSLWAFSDMLLVFSTRAFFFVGWSCRFPWFDSASPGFELFD